VVEALGTNGIKVNDGLVYAVKGSMKEKKRRKKRVARAAMAAVRKPSSNGNLSGERKPTAPPFDRTFSPHSPDEGTKLSALTAALG